MTETNVCPHLEPVPAAKFGMWLFLFSEFLLFGTVFIAYAVYLHEYTRDFQAGSALLSTPIGAVNTVVLLTSSLTMAAAVAAVRRRHTTLARVLLAATIGCAVIFLAIKSVEWSEKFHHGIYPWIAPVDWPTGKQLFFRLYFLMTGLHALHVAVGAVVIAVAAVFVKTDRIAPLENTGLYWHLVDIVWIYLFPLFYLIG